MPRRKMRSNTHPPFEVIDDPRVESTSKRDILKRYMAHMLRVEYGAFAEVPPTIDLHACELRHLMYLSLNVALLHDAQATLLPDLQFFHYRGLRNIRETVYEDIIQPSQDLFPQFPQYALQFIGEFSDKFLRSHLNVQYPGQLKGADETKSTSFYALRIKSSLTKRCAPIPGLSEASWTPTKRSTTLSICLQRQQTNISPARMVPEKLEMV